MPFGFEMAVFMVVIISVLWLLVRLRDGGEAS